MYSQSFNQMLGRQRKNDTQSVVVDQDDLPTIIPRRRRIRHIPSTGDVCDLGSRQSASAEGGESLLDTINRVDNLRDMPVVLQGNVINHNIDIPLVEETVNVPNMCHNFPRCIPLSTRNSADIKIKSRRDMPNQSFIDKMLGLLNHKSRHFYHLPFD